MISSLSTSRQIWILTFLNFHWRKDHSRSIPMITPTWPSIAFTTLKNCTQEVSTMRRLQRFSPGTFTPRFLFSVANAYWNNLFEDPGNKTTDWETPAYSKFLCPTRRKPFLLTKKNFRMDFTKSHWLRVPKIPIQFNVFLRGRWGALTRTFYIIR